MGSNPVFFHVVLSLSHISSAVHIIVWLFHIFTIIKVILCVKCRYECPVSQSPRTECLSDRLVFIISPQTHWWLGFLLASLGTGIKGHSKIHSPVTTHNNARARACAYHNLACWRRYWLNGDSFLVESCTTSRTKFESFQWISRYKKVMACQLLIFVCCQKLVWTRKQYQIPQDHL